MNILSSFNSGILTIAVQGRIDSSEAPNFQKQINAAIDSVHDQRNEGSDSTPIMGVEGLILDAQKLEYISSMGLRVILQLKRKFKDLRIINCSAEVFNVFKMTGFTGMITVERALPAISLEGLTPIKGSNANVSDSSALGGLYELTDETMLKVFHANACREDVDRIVKLTKHAFIMEVPTPMTFEIKTIACKKKKADEGTTVNERIALIYEKAIPTDINPRTLGNMLRELHEHIIEPNGIIPSAAAKVRERIQSLRPYLGDDNVAKLKQMFSALPDGSCLLHGNLSLNEIAQCNGDYVFMDMGEICYGNAVIDLANLYSSLSDDKRGIFFEELLHAYYDIESVDTIERNRQNIITFSIIMDFTRLLGTCDALTDYEPTEEQIEAARRDFEERIAAHWDEILSHLHFKMDFNEEIRKLERQRFYTDSDVNIDWVANKIGTNRHYVSDYFNKVLHTSFSDYINTQRLDYAVELIHSGRVPSSQIAYTVGFNNDHTFRRIFKQRFGCTPSQFK